MYTYIIPPNCPQTFWLRWYIGQELNFSFGMALSKLSKVQFAFIYVYTCVKFVVQVSGSGESGEAMIPSGNLANAVHNVMYVRSFQYVILQYLNQFT